MRALYLRTYEQSKSSHVFELHMHQLRRFCFFNNISFLFFILRSISWALLLLAAFKRSENKQYMFVAQCCLTVKWKDESWSKLIFLRLFRTINNTIKAKRPETITQKCHLCVLVHIDVDVPIHRSFLFSFYYNCNSRCDQEKSHKEKERIAISFYHFHTAQLSRRVLGHSSVSMWDFSSYFFSFSSLFWLLSGLLAL